MTDIRDAGKPGRRFPFPLPFGWFSLGRLDELPTEPVAPVGAFGRDLVLWTDGTDHRVFDAFCPHLGAHFGHGGRVEDGCLICPFHEWSFAADGSNTSIPYANRPNGRARVRSYPVVIRDPYVSSGTARIPRSSRCGTSPRPSPNDRSRRCA